MTEMGKTEQNLRPQHNMEPEQKVESRPLGNMDEQKREQFKQEVTVIGQNNEQRVQAMVPEESTEQLRQQEEYNTEQKPQAIVPEITEQPKVQETYELEQKQKQEVIVALPVNTEQPRPHETIVNEDNAEQAIPQVNTKFEQNIEPSNNQETIVVKQTIEPPKSEQQMVIENTTEQTILSEIPTQLVQQKKEHLAQTQGNKINDDLKRKLQQISCANYNHYNSYFAEDGNQIWAGALTLAWKELLQNYTENKPLMISGHQDIATNFNQCRFKKEQIDNKSTLIKSGYGQQTVTQINAQMAEKFPDCSFSPLNAQLGPQDLIAYAYLFKKLLFDVQFQKHEYNRLMFTGQNHPQKLVPSFYVDNAKQARQIQIQSWISNEDFIVSLKNSSPTDKIYLYKPPANKKLSVGQVIQEIVFTEKKNQSLSQLQEFRHDIDKFEMPILDLNYKHSYTELTGLAIQNDCHLKGFRFLEVAEGLKLKIDEKGVRCESYGFMIVNECSVSGPNPKQLHFDRPFWIVMKERNRHPYLCIHINNI